MKDPIIAIDLGGTHLRTAIIDTFSGEVHHSVRVKSLAHLGHIDVIGRMVDLINRVINESGIDKKSILAIGVGVPGTVELSTGTIIFLPNMPGQWRGVHLSSVLQDALGLPAYILNDVRSITLGEWSFGAGRGAESMACFAIGTGIGGGIILNQKLQLNFGGTAGELGHIVVEPNGLPCGCGGYGCLEMYASGPAIASLGKKFVMHGHTTLISELVNQKIENITTEIVIRAAKEGDPKAVYILKQAGYYLGVAVNNVLVSIGPERVVFAGGVSEAGELLIHHVRNYLNNQVFMMPVNEVVITVARLGTNAGLVGAALWAKQNLLQSK
jgi:glucokinase